MVEPNVNYRHLQHPTDAFARLRIEALERDNKALKRENNALERQIKYLLNKVAL